MSGGAHGNASMPDEGIWGSPWEILESEPSSLENLFSSNSHSSMDIACHPAQAMFDEDESSDDNKFTNDEGSEKVEWMSASQTGDHPVRGLPPPNMSPLAEPISTDVEPSSATAGNSVPKATDALHDVDAAGAVRKGSGGGCKVKVRTRGAASAICDPITHCNRCDYVPQDKPNWNHQQCKILNQAFDANPSPSKDQAQHLVELLEQKEQPMTLAQVSDRTCANDFLVRSETCP
jgi:hypothetical protein